MTRWTCWTLTAMLAVIGLMGCDSLRHFEVEQSDAVRMLKVEIPSSATNVESDSAVGVGYELEFLMPDDQWRGYVQIYFPADQIVAKSPARSADVQRPALCTEPVSATVPGWRAQDTLPYGKTKEARRFVWITPNCTSELAYIHWLFIPPNPG